MSTYTINLAHTVGTAHKMGRATFIYTGNSIQTTNSLLKGNQQNIQQTNTISQEISKDSFKKQINSINCVDTVVWVIDRNPVVSQTMSLSSDCAAYIARMSCEEEIEEYTFRME